MTGSRYLSWFFGLAGAAVAAIIAFNALAEHYILNHRAGASVQLVSGFERVLKPAWLDRIKPDLVFIGSSRSRMGFDPALVDPEFKTRSFNYGVSSASAYETHRFIQDSAAQPSVKRLIVGLDAFTSGSAAQPYGGGFDELRLAVTPEGAPTPRRELWLTTARYLTGGGLGMHGLGVWLLIRLAPDEMANNRPDIFTAYGYMTKKVFERQMTRRTERSMKLTPWQKEQLTASFATLCHAKAEAIFFFPPDNLAVINRYIANDPAGFADFKQWIKDAVARHNKSCPNKIRLFDFLTENPITRDNLAARGKLSPYYADPVHFRPPTGQMLLRHMLRGEPIK